MGKYVAIAIAAASLTGCYTTPAYESSAAAGGTAPATVGTHEVRAAFNNGVTKNVLTDYNLREGDRVIMLSNGKVGPL